MAPQTGPTDSEIMEKGKSSGETPQQNGKDEAQDEETNSGRLTFNIEDRPPIHIALFYGFQIIFTNLPASMAAVFLIHQATCGGRDYEFLAKLMSSVIFMCGFASLLQVLFGSRLPIAQGSSFVFFSPIIAMMASERWKCTQANAPVPMNVTQTAGMTNGSFDEVMDPEWVPRVARLSGGLIAASCFQVFLGATGLMGYLMRFIGPVTLAPTVMLIGINLFPVAVDSSRHQWWISTLTIALIVIFSTICAEIKVPILTWNRKRGFHVQRYTLIKMFSNLITIAIVWLLCYILTVTGSLTDDPNELGYLTRTDAKIDAMRKMPWFYFPYPGQFGTFTFGFDIIIGMVASTLASTLESIGDYYATARIVEVPKPPIHTINRGIALEGVASIFCGLIGCCHGTTSYSNVIGFISYTGVASRFTWVIMSVMMMVFAVIGKFAGALASIPEPIVGGMTAICLGLVVLIGMSQLHSVDLMSTRNQIALAVALTFGITFPDYLARTPGAINTGNETADRTLLVFLSTGAFVAGFLGFLLDNILPGTRAERGMLPEDDGLDPEARKLSPEQVERLYDFPLPTLWLAKYKFCTFLPFMPCYRQRECPCSCRRKNKSSNVTDEGTTDKKTDVRNGRRDEEAVWHSSHF